MSRPLPSSHPRHPARIVDDTAPAAPPPPLATVEEYAAAVEEAVTVAAVTAALDALEDAATAARDVIATAVRTTSFRPLAQQTGLTVGTLQRWRYELSIAATLRAARNRRPAQRP